ncbi:MAG: hypothetical protein QOE82_2534 [Thermoanaerobaculia bacterium]|jgi:hypothetical protein|nr:hypothetical protein [Thermoanaerobaculia bacterium]
MLVTLVRIGLWILPFRVLHRAVVARSSRRGSSNHSIDAITWAVTAAARRVPRATCLTQALAGMLLLGANGHPAMLRVGVAKKEDGGLRAHAWIDSGGETILGDPRSDALVSLPPIAFPG